MISSRSLFVAGVLLLSTALPATAHRPLTIGGTFPSHDQALRVTDRDVSQVAYVELTDAAPALWLAFDAEAGTHVDVSLGVPVLDRLIAYRPNLALLGPGLPPLALPLESAPDLGGRLFESAAREPRPFHEPFTGTASWIVFEESIELPESGTYYLVAWSPDEIVDKLWVAVGWREHYGLEDVLALPTILRDVRAFHEVPAGPSAIATAGKVLFLAAAALLVAFLL